jgi:enediyne biosynthesis protein E4
MNYNRNQITAIAAIVLMLGITVIACRFIEPRDAAAARVEATHFAFEHATLSYLNQEAAYVRKVNPAFTHMQSWISAVGAAVAINDLDGDGLNNDICLVDTRNDSVTIAPVPGTGQRYRPFQLRPDGPAIESVAPMGCLPGDFYQDGRMDILIYYWGRPPVLFAAQKRKPGSPFDASAFLAQDLAPADERWFTNAALFADFDGDGHPDLLIANYFADGAQILDSTDSHPQQMNSSMSHAYNGGCKHFFLAHVDADGLLHFVESTPKFSDANGDPLDPGQVDDILHGWTLAAATADLNHRLLPDLYLANDFGPDRMLQNESTPGSLNFRLINGKRGFFNPKSKVLGRDSFKGMGVEFADLNNEGKLDLLVSNITDEFALEESNLVFVNTCPDSGSVDLSICMHEQSEKLGLARSGWSWDVKAADFDNSGKMEVVQATGFIRSSQSALGIRRWPELHETAMGNDITLRYPGTWHNYSTGDNMSAEDINRFYVPEENGRYQDISADLGLHHDAPARGIAVADVYGNGKLDFVVANQWAASDFYRNVTPANGSFLELRLLLPLKFGQPFALHPMSNLPDTTYAITAKALVTLPDGHHQLQEVNDGNGHSGKSSFDLHFGLGAVAEKQKIAVLLQWRDISGQIKQRELQLRPGLYSILLGE